MRHDWEFVTRNAIVDSAGELEGRDEAITLIADFLDRFLLATVQPYEEGEKR